MIIENVRICASASKNYQKFDVEFTASNVSDQDLITLKQMAITEAMTGVSQMCVDDNTTSKVETKTTPMPNQQYQAPVQQQSYRTNVPQQNLSAPHTNNPKPTYDDNYPAIGTVQNFGGADYTFCFSRQNNSYYWKINNEALIAQGFKKYMSIK